MLSLSWEYARLMENISETFNLAHSREMEHLSNGSTSYVKYITGKEELTFTGK
jgi:hypothetical protein